MIDAAASMMSWFPVLGLAALGSLITSKTGVLNIGIEGVVGLGTFMGILGYHLTASPWIALGFGIGGGVVLAAILALFCIHWKLDQIVTGFGIWFLGSGLAGFLYFTLIEESVDVTKTFPTLGGLDAIFYISVALFALFYFFLNWTKGGLAVIAVGESPSMADSAGIDVGKVRWICTLVGGGLMGLSGAYLSVAILESFTYTMASGYGWVAFALMIFGNYRTGGVLLGCAFFTFLEGIQMRMQVAGFTVLPPEIMVELPFIIVAIVLAIQGIRGIKGGAPSSLAKPYKREARV
jgi:simple sugar transport system permease protein